MNLRQKYKKAKRELEFYKSHKAGDYTLVKKENVPVQTLCYDHYTSSRSPIPPEYIDDRVRDEILRAARRFIKIERRIQWDRTMVRGSLEIVDRGKPMQLHDGMKIDVAIVDENEPLFIKEQLYPAETYF